MPRLFYPPLVEPGVYILPWHQRKKRYSLKLYRKNEKLRYDCPAEPFPFFFCFNPYLFSHTPNTILPLPPLSG